VISCAYCDKECNPTREHVVPRWYIKAVGKDGIETFNARSPTKHIRGDILVKDVCKECNSGPLGTLDAYGKRLYFDLLRHPVYYGESVDLNCDYELLLRWLLKLCFNSARVHNSDVSILVKYKDFLLGNSPIPAPVSTYAHLVAATDFGTTPPTPAHRIIGGDDDIDEPRWFRLTQFRTNVDFMSEIVQRQVYIDGFCFTLLVPDPNRIEHTEQLSQLETRFTEWTRDAKRLPSSGQVRVTAHAVHAYSCIEDHLLNYPTRYADGAPSESSEFSDVISDMLDGEVKALAVCVTREEIDSGDTSQIVARLNELVATRESAIGAMQRVAIWSDGFDDDSRELWEIPAVVNFLQEVFSACPFLFFLAMPESKTVQLFAACCCSCCADRTHTDELIEFDTEMLRTFMDTGFRGLNEVTQRFAISIEINRAISETALRFLKVLQPCDAKAAQ